MILLELLLQRTRIILRVLGKVLCVVRVLLDIKKPLRVRMKMKKPGADWFWVNFRYERLPSFCFHCGVIGHGDRFCPVAFATEVVGKEKPFGSWLRAGGKNPPPVPKNRWLVLDPVTVDTRKAGQREGSVTAGIKDS